MENNIENNIMDLGAIMEEIIKIEEDRDLAIREIVSYLDSVITIFKDNLNKYHSGENINLGSYKIGSTTIIVQFLSNNLFYYITKENEIVSDAKVLNINNLPKFSDITFVYNLLKTILNSYLSYIKDITDKMKYIGIKKEDNINLIEKPLPKLLIAEEPDIKPELEAIKEELEKIVDNKEEIISPKSKGILGSIFSK